ncbi:WAP four-disulfide core domain [Chamberlinius hualienensis]
MTISMSKSILVLFFVTLTVLTVNGQGCASCNEDHIRDRKCCQRFKLCCSGENVPPFSNPFQRPGLCPPDRFPNANVTVCLRKICQRDSECSIFQKCCPFGLTRCCVYPQVF